MEADDYRTFSTDRFSSSAWHKKPTREEQLTCYRGGMAYDVMKNVLQKGMPRAEVDARLGPPDTRYGGYYLGLCGVLDGYSLQPRYDASGRLHRSNLVQH